ncbi:MAG: restriction endonuclease subunit S [Clostridia bacterium]|nr:restriction endonuclease subunit S [Clostridia bacterium]
MSFKLSIGKTAITAEELYTNEAIMAFIDKGIYAIDPTYFYHLCCGKNWTDGTNKAVMGLTLNKATISEIEIDLPDISEQMEVAAKLDRLDTVIADRQLQLEYLDQLVKSRFIELFGDPVYNTKNLPTKRLAELGSLDRGRSQHRPRNAPELLGGPYPLIQTGEVANAGLYITGYSNTYSELGLKQSKMWKAGTLCITIAANIAQTSILTFDACFPDSVVGFIPGDSISAIYMHYWFGFFQKILEEQAPQVAQKNINLKILSDLSVVVPNQEQQKDFIAFVKQTDKSKLAVQQGLQELEILKKSLMQQYFG